MELARTSFSLFRYLYAELSQLCYITAPNHNLATPYPHVMHLKYMVRIGHIHMLNRTGVSEKVIGIAVHTLCSAIHCPQ